MHDEKISIVVPAYCAPEKVARFLDGLLENDYPDQNVEVILIDDCSPVSLANVVESYMHKFAGSTNLIFHRNSQNSGRAFSRNIGYLLATARVIMFLDVDNILEKNAIKNAMSFFRGKDFVCARINIRISPQRVTESNYIRYFDSRYLGARGVQEERISTRYFASDGILITRDILEEIGAFDEDFRHYGCEDEELGIRISKAGYPFYFLPTVLAEDSDIPTIRRASERMVTYASCSFPLLIKKHPECIGDCLFSSFELLLADKRVAHKLIVSGIHYFPVVSFKRIMLKFCERMDKSKICIPDFFYKAILALSYIEGGRIRIRGK
ncbi:glycosyltransferase [Vagococcus sp. WN89Y]|uniref:glycosyltransferase n=1 Tax=Vagococcus sp. WN89Y TaxID=3457258 RepID=UPI003FCCB393